MSIKYVHTNIVCNNWGKLAFFYQKVFECVPVLPLRNQSGEWLDKATGLSNAHIKGVHLKLPGYGNDGPTLEIYEYTKMVDKPESVFANRKGFGHIAFLVSDVGTTVQHVLNNGGKALGDLSIKDVPEIGRLTFIYMTDPENNIIEIQNWSIENYE